MRGIKNSRLTGPNIISVVLFIFGLVGLLVLQTSTNPSRFINGVWFLSSVWLLAWFLLSARSDPKIADSKIFSLERAYPAILLAFCYLITWSSFFILLYYSQSTTAVLCLYLVTLLFVLYVKYGSSDSFKRRFASDALIIVLLLTIITLFKTIFSLNESASMTFTGTFLTFLKDFNFIDQEIINNSVLEYYFVLLFILWFMFSAIQPIQPEPKNLRVILWGTLSFVELILIFLGLRPIVGALLVQDTARITSISTFVNIIVVTISIFFIGLIYASTTSKTFRKDQKNNLKP